MLYNILIHTHTSSVLCDRTKIQQVTRTILNSHGMRFTFQMTWTKWVHKQQTRTRSQLTMSQSICHSRWVTIILWLDINRNWMYVNKTNDSMHSAYIYIAQTNKDLTAIIYSLFDFYFVFFFCFLFLYFSVPYAYLCRFVYFLI